MDEMFELCRDTQCDGKRHRLDERCRDRDGVEGNMCAAAGRKHTYECSAEKAA